MKHDSYSSLSKQKNHLVDELIKNHLIYQQCIALQIKCTKSRLDLVSIKHGLFNMDEPNDIQNFLNSSVASFKSYALISGISLNKYLLMVP